MVQSGRGVRAGVIQDCVAHNSVVENGSVMQDGGMRAGDRAQKEGEAQEDRPESDAIRLEATALMALQSGFIPAALWYVGAVTMAPDHHGAPGRSGGLGRQSGRHSRDGAIWRARGRDRAGRSAVWGRDLASRDSVVV